MEIVTSGYNRNCKSSQGGLDKIWLFPYVKYSRSQIATDANFLVSFPQTTIYSFYSNGTPIFSEDNETEDGGKYYNQSINLELNGVENIDRLLKKDYRVIIKDNNGYFRILGLYVGLECEKIDYNSGSNKQSFNGYSLSFTGKEEKPSFFIENLEDAGFVDNDIVFRITEAGEFRVTENDEFRILG